MDQAERAGGQGAQLGTLLPPASDGALRTPPDSSAPVARRAGPALCALAVCLAVLWGPPPIRHAEAWLRYRVAGSVPPPIVAGRHGRLFLGNHTGAAPGSLIAGICGGAGPAAIARAAGLIRPVLAAGRAAGVPFRFVIVPTAPRLYPEDLPAGMPCADPAADRLATALDDPAVIYPVAAMQAMKARFEVLPRRHFHWAGEGPLRVAEFVAAGMGLHQSLTLPLRLDNRASDLDSFDPGLALTDPIGTADLRAAGVAQCTGARCDPGLPEALTAYARPGPGRLLLIADSFGEEVAGDFSEFAGQVRLVRMNPALGTPPAVLADALAGFGPTAVIVLYHDAGALALDDASQASLALAARLLADAALPLPAFGH